MRLRFPLLGFVFCPLVLHGQSLPRAEAFNPALVYGVAVAYTTPSQNIINGLAPSRQLFLLSATADWRAHVARHFVYRWQVEVLPLVLIRNPHEVSDLTLLLNSGDTESAHFDGLVLKPCISGTSTAPYYSGAATPIGTLTRVNVCDSRWTYSGGISPLGQRLNFRPHERLQPFAQANAGFIASARSVPVDDTTRFNFTAELGGGAEWFYSARHSVAFSVIYHHLSNAGRGNENPSIENFTFRTSLRFGR